MFWGLVLKPNKRYSQVVIKAFHLSQAALDTTSQSNDSVQVVLTSDKHNYILCTLKKNKTEQVALDLNFVEGEEISFTSQGGGSVHLSGYLLPDSEDDVLDQLSDEEEEKSLPKKASGKKEEKTLLTLGNALEESEDEDDSDFDVENEGEDEEDEGDSDEVEEDDDEDVDDEEDESEGEEVKEPQPKQMKLAKKSKQNGLENGKAQTKEKTKEQKDKQKQNQNQNQSKDGGEKSLQGGVKVRDVRVGTGPEAKSGKKVQVYYEGRLKSNNKVFDSTKQGPGFKFLLGRGEVISGWDVGVVGMKVGGKRRIICPPNMAYGAKGQPPVIPPDSTLVFEVELKSVH